MNQSTHTTRVIAGKYRITGVLGKGGMGLVSRADQLDVQGHVLREVAVKTILLDTSDQFGEMMVRRFQREARSAARLNNPHVVMVHDIGQETDGELYFVMELVDGPTLREAAPHGLGLEHAVTIGAQVCEALIEAHGLPEPIVHRDLKPTNLFLQRWPQSVWVKVGDFGIAKIVGEETSGLTNTGSSIGTPLYMAPEQWRGEPVDGRADLYALGGVLYQMLAGRTPFQGEQMVLMYKHLHDRPPPLPAAVPAPLRAIVESMLEKEPQNRPATAAEVRASLLSIFNASRISGGADSFAAMSSRQSPQALPVNASVDRGGAENAPTVAVVPPQVVPGQGNADKPSPPVTAAVRSGSVAHGVDGVPTSMWAAAAVLIVAAAGMGIWWSGHRHLSAEDEGSIDTHSISSAAPVDAGAPDAAAATNAATKAATTAATPAAATAATATPALAANVPCKLDSGGMTYEGSCQNGIPNGQGTRTDKTGKHEQGMFRDGLLNGDGTMVLANGDRIEGNFHAGMVTGQGMYTWADRTVYKGEILANSATGVGVKTWVNGIRQQGDFRHGVLSGHGTVLFPSGDQVQGEFIEGVLNGQGSYTWKNGARYEGEFRASVPTGKGIKTFPNGDQERGDFRKGVLVNGSSSHDGTTCAVKEGQVIASDCKK